MAISTGGGKGGPSWQINMTPMIDVLLVLLIIFMVIQPTLQKGIEVQVPPVEERPSQEAAVDQITLEIRPDPTTSSTACPCPRPSCARRSAASSPIGRGRCCS
jgi:biopolymer transport protein ExbD